MHNDPAHNATWSLFWEAHPGPDGTFTPEVWVLPGRRQSQQ